MLEGYIAYSLPEILIEYANMMICMTIKRTDFRRSTKTSAIVLLQSFIFYTTRVGMFVSKLLLHRRNAFHK